jgi:glyoxylase-like metal-dependent hydrolase (beta-lactamase superfamily II)
MRTETLRTRPEIAGLHPTTPQPLPFDPSIAARAFLLEREPGNLLIYSTGSLEADVPALVENGGVERQYLNHWHEAMFGSDVAARRLGAKVLVNRSDAAAAERRDWRVDYSFARRHTVDSDFEAIPIPGHTPGATAYLWDSGQHRLLFTGDTIYLRDGEWIAAVLESSDRERYTDSLELLRGLEFDVLVPWAATLDQPFLSAVDPAERRKRITAILERLRRGEDH